MVAKLQIIYPSEVEKALKRVENSSKQMCPTPTPPLKGRGAACAIRYFNLTYPLV